MSVEPIPGPLAELDQDTRHSDVDWRLGAANRVAALTVLWHPSTERIGDRVLLAGLERGHDVRISRLEPELSPPRGGAARPLALPHLSRSPFRLARGEGGAIAVLRAEWSVPLEVDGVELGERRLVSAEELGSGVVLLLAGRVVLLLHRVDPIRLGSSGPRLGLIGESDSIGVLRSRIVGAAEVEAPVLLRGETGSGKELVARAIHDQSARRPHPFVAVNIAALPPALAAAEIFGAARGAYTGSTGERVGYFRRAHRGSLFLDEIGDASAEVQVMLYRVLETGSVLSLGEDHDRPVDVRVISATDADLEHAISNDRFRGPLLHRLAGHEIAVPALRERRDDVGRLLWAFLSEELRSLGAEGRLEQGDRPAWLPAPLVARLARLDWPGNVRQLRNVCRELALLGRDREHVEIGPQLQRLLTPQVAIEPPAAASPSPRGEVRRRPAEVSEAELEEALAANQWRLKPTAEYLGIARSSLYALMRAHPRTRTAVELDAAEIERQWQDTSGDVEAMARELEVSKDGLLRRLRELGRV